MELYVASYRITDDNWGSTSAPMEMDRAKAFILDALDRVKLGPTATAHDYDNRVKARDAFLGTSRPLTFKVGIWEFRIERHNG